VWKLINKSKLYCAHAITDVMIKTSASSSESSRSLSIWHVVSVLEVFHLPLASERSWGPIFSSALLEPRVALPAKFHQNWLSSSPPGHVEHFADTQTNKIWTRIPQNKQVVLLTGTARSHTPMSAIYIRSRGRVWWGDILVTPAQCTGKFIVCTCTSHSLTTC